jgi:hypothetical protein
MSSASLNNLKSLFGLKPFSPFTYNKVILSVKSINAFNVSSRCSNDKNNKLREHIIGALINNKVPENYFVLAKWLTMKYNLSNYINSLSTKCYIKVDCKNKAGRANKYDFLIKLYYTQDTYDEYKVEFKFNASSLDKAPQFVSPMKPSRYLSSSYEEFYYTNYLTKLALKGNLKMPPKEEYLKHVHSNKPKCMTDYQDLYYKGCRSSSKFTGNQEHIDFYNYAKELSSISISEFIESNELNIAMLSNYLQTSQANKIYMLYTNNTFIKQIINSDDYMLIDVIKHSNSYECISKSGKKIYALIRWKNGNGIALPAFQISSG